MLPRMTAHLLTRHSHRAPDPRPALQFLDGLTLPLGRAHEVCGDARRTLAAMIAARTEGPVFWIVPSWVPDRLHPEGVLRLFDPGRIVFLEPKRAEDLLWCLEEVLRAGMVALAVADLPAPPGLTAVRRLHLAAETGAGESGRAPLGLLLTPGDGGAPGVETRWRMQAAHGVATAETAQGIAEIRPSWRLDRLRARTAPVKGWQVLPGTAGFRTAPLAA